MGETVPSSLPAIAIILSLSALAFAAPAPEPLVKEGKSPHAIILSSSASPSEQRGAKELQVHLRAMSGAELPIVTDPADLPPHAILVGRGRHTEALGIRPDLEKLGPDGFVLKTVGGRLAIVGSPVRGTMYGCSTFLEKLGVRWYTPRVTHTPARPTIDLPILDEQQIPAFEYREPFFTEAFDKDWAARLRTNGAHQRLDDSTGGKITYFPFVHSFDKLVAPSLFDTHPEYFPIIKGKRTGGYVQRCLSNPDVLRLSIEAVRRWIAEQPKAKIYSVSQNDCYQFCECEACKAIEAKYGNTHAGLYLWFVNQIAAAIEKDHPDKLIDTLAYQFTEQTPTGIVPRKNVRVRLCPIACCEAHPYEKCMHKANVAFVKNLAEWAKITDTLYIWHYNTNFAHYLLPFPDFDQFPDSTRLYLRSGVKGIFFQGAYAPGGGGSDAELRSYVMAKLLWDPSADSDVLVNEWMAAIYGPAMKPMRQWFDLLHEKARTPDRHFHIFDPVTAHYLSDETMKAGNALMDEAGKLAAGNPVATEYITRARLGLRYIALVRKPTDGPDYTSFLADLKTLGIRQVNEHRSLEQWQVEYLKRAIKTQ